jgi:hypothetical protein
MKVQDLSGHAKGVTLNIDNVQEHPILKSLCPFDESRELDFQFVAKRLEQLGVGRRET